MMEVKGLTPICKRADDAQPAQIAGEARKDRVLRKICLVQWPRTEKWLLDRIEHNVR